MKIEIFNLAVEYDNIINCILKLKKYLKKNPEITIDDMSIPSIFAKDINQLLTEYFDKQLEKYKTEFNNL